MPTGPMLPITRINRLLTAFRSRIARKVGLLLLVPSCGAFSAFMLLWYFLAQTAPVPTELNVAGRQRMLAVQLGDRAGAIAAGQREAGSQIEDLVDTYELSLKALEHGGQVEGRTVLPVPRGPRMELERLRAKWNEVRPRLLALAAPPARRSETEDAARKLGPDVEVLRLHADALTWAIETRVGRLRRRIQWVLAGSVLLTAAMLVLGYRYARRYVVDPVLMVNDAAKRVSNGDYSVHLLCMTRDELCDLTRTFNEMTHRVQRLVQDVDLRRRHADTLVEGLPLGAVLMDAELGVLRTNQAFRRIVGVVGDAACGRCVTEFLPVPGLRDRLLRLLADGELVDLLPTEIETAGGSRWIRISATSTGLTGEEGRLLLLVEDMTEEERLRTATRDSEESFRALIEGSPDAIAVHRDGRLIYVNSALVTTLGYRTVDELLGKHVLDIVHPDDRAFVNEEIRTMLASSKPSPAAELRFVKKDGAVTTAEVLGLEVLFGGEPALLAVARDVTQRKELIGKMMEMDRLIAMGTLAAGVGHEINNPLSYLMANLDAVAEELPGVVGACQQHQGGLEPVLGAGAAVGSVSCRLGELIEMVDDARHGAQRVRAIVRDLKKLSRAESEQRSPLDVRRVLESSIDMTWHEIRHRARIMKDFDDAPPVEANEARLGQVFINLLVNAAQAIPEGASDVNTIRVRCRGEGEKVIVEVEDTGSGIPKDQLARLFEPFFTTKAIGEGTGLGLAICRRTVESHGGTIEVDSLLGRGTKFKVTLPAAHELQPAPKDGGCASIPAPRRGQVLVVDDEPMIGRIMARGLGVDHAVTTLTSGREARDRIASGERFDVIFCDLMMPEMTGMELHDELTAVAPEQAERMIFLTGGAFTPRTRAFLDTVPNQRLDALVRDLLGPGRP